MKVYRAMHTNEVIDEDEAFDYVRGIIRRF